MRSDGKYMGKDDIRRGMLSLWLAGAMAAPVIHAASGAGWLQALGTGALFGLVLPLANRGVEALRWTKIHGAAFWWTLALLTATAF